MLNEKIIPSDDYRVKVATVVDMADKWFRQADGGELDKYDEIELLDACKSVLKFHGLTVVDPAKCMVLSRVEGVPEEGQVLIQWFGGNYSVSPASIITQSHLDVITGIYPLPTEAR